MSHLAPVSRRPRVVLGVGGGIAAYKACALSRLFSEGGADVWVVPTEAALHFVGAATWEALSGHPVSSTVWDGVDEVRHVRLGQEADLVVVAPATADLLARAAAGLASDLLTNVLLTARCPVVMAPAMHTEMWAHPATVTNVATLRARGVTVVEPAEGRLTGADSGPGRLPEPEEIHRAALEVLRASRAAGGQAGDPEAGGSADALAGRRVVVTAGGTREPLDPVRFLGNRSSGKQGLALAAEAARRGASVSLIGANIDLAVPAGVECVRVGSALELQAAVEAAYEGSDVVVMAAAVADFRPRDYAPTKIKKRHDPGHDADAPVIELVRNPDILAGLVARRAEAGASRRPLCGGFAAETGDESGSVLDLARAKLARKGCDLLVANQVGADQVFGKDETCVSVLAPGRDDPLVQVSGTKDEAARAVWDAVATLL